MNKQQNMDNKEWQAYEDNFARVLDSKEFIYSAFQTYGGAAGFQTYGANGLKLRNNIVKIWREMFVDDMCDPYDRSSMVYEIDSPGITPAEILQASGHVERFTDPVVRDAQGKLERVDHYLKDRIRDPSYKLSPVQISKIEAQLETTDVTVLQRLIDDYGETKRGFGSVYNANLMLSTNTTYADHVSYLRPETAQGSFVEFPRLFRANNEILPFGIAHIGKAYRKEINTSPFTRLREFYQSELEYFYDPKGAKTTSDIRMPQKIETIFTQTLIKVTTKHDPNSIRVVTLYDIVTERIIESYLIYKFVIKALLFCMRVGVDPLRLRLRQHGDDELAHYSSDCWDIEFDRAITITDSDTDDETSHSWLEIIGISDRGCYDLMSHQSTIGKACIAKRYHDEPIQKTVYEIEPDKRYWGKTYRRDAPKLIEGTIKIMRQKLESGEFGIDDGSYTIEFDEEIRSDADPDTVYRSIEVHSDNIDIQRVTKLEYYEEFVPHVIEPSFGVDRIMYSILRSAFILRSDDGDGGEDNKSESNDKNEMIQRSIMSFAEEVCPIKYAVISLINTPEHFDVVKRIDKLLSDLRCERTIDKSSASIGRKYARLDEIGVDTVFTVDNQTIRDGTITIRDRDTMEQRRIDVNHIANFVEAKCRSTSEQNYSKLTNF